MDMRNTRWWLRLLGVAMCLAMTGFGAGARADLDPFENVVVFQQPETYQGVSRPVVYMRPLVPSPTPAPVMILLTYRGGDPTSMADLVQAGRLVRDYGAWVVIPRAENGMWNYRTGSLGTGGYYDPGFLAQLMTDLPLNFPVDARRLYMGGYSDGGFMTETMACMYPDLLAGGMIVGGKMARDVSKACKPSRGTPMIYFDGTNDGVSFYAGGISSLSAPASASFWAGLNGCSTRAVVKSIPASFNDNTYTPILLSTYNKCPGTSLPMVELYTVWTGGHTWPGALDYSPELGTTTQQVDATLVGFQFLSQFSR
jgi:polyhydroxybutyrate depolymerase